MFLVSFWAIWGELLVHEEDRLLAQGEACHMKDAQGRRYFSCARTIFLVQEEDLLLVQEEDKVWSPEKLKMVKKHFFPELSGDLWGVICYHHWYPRAGLEGPEKSFFKLQNEVLNDAELPPEYFPCIGSA